MSYKTQKLGKREDVSACRYLETGELELTYMAIKMVQNIKLDDFESGLFWELYRGMESSFMNFLDYVPFFKGNEDVYSPKLLALIQQIGNYVDSAFKEMARYKGFTSNSGCKTIREKKDDSKIVNMSLYRETFEKLYCLSSVDVYAKVLPTRRKLAPFEEFEHNKSPEWWKIYNKLKHDLAINLHKANLNNTLRALAGAFVLNVVHIPSAIRLFDYGVMKAKIMTEPDAPSMHISKYHVKTIIKTGRRYPFVVETPLFFYERSQDFPVADETFRGLKELYEDSEDRNAPDIEEIVNKTD